MVLYGVSIEHYIMMFNWIARNSKENESEQVTTILSVAYVIYAIQLNSQCHNSIVYVFVHPGACVCGWSGIGCCYCSCADTLLHRIYVVNIILAVKVSFAKLTPHFCPSQYFFLIILIILIIMSSPKNYGLQVSKDVCITRVYYKMISEPYP